MTNQQVMAAVKALIEHDEKFLIIRHKYGNGTFWDIPGGRVEYGENPYDTLHREVKEEVHLEVEIVRPLGVWWFYRTLSDNKQVVCTTFLCKPKHTNVDLSKNPVEIENIEEYKWVTKEELLEWELFSNESLKDLIRSSL